MVIEYPAPPFAALLGTPVAAALTDPPSARCPWTGRSLCRLRCRRAMSRFCAASSGKAIRPARTKGVLHSAYLAGVHAQKVIASPGRCSLAHAGGHSPRPADCRLSGARKNSASATWARESTSLPSRSAIVLATLSTRWYPRADSRRRSAAVVSSDRASTAIGVRASSHRP